MKARLLLGALPLLACQAILGIEDTPLEPRAIAAAGEAGAAGASAAVGSEGGSAGLPSEQPSLLGSQAGHAGGGGEGESVTGPQRHDEGGAAGEAGDAGAPPVVGGADADWPVHSKERIFKVTHPWPHMWLSACANVETSDVQAGEAFWLHAQTLIADSWLRAADIMIIFAGACLEDHLYSFRFKINDGAAFETSVGYPGGLGGLNITLGVASSDAQVLYAFGRALGFEHELGRDAYTGACVACEQQSDCKQPGRTTCLSTGYCGNPADHESIMAAPDCGGIDPERRLTTRDVLGAQRAYGRKPPGSLLGGRNMCWNAEYGIPAANLRITAWPCLNADNELWARRRVEDDDTLEATIAGQPFCAAASGTGAVRPLSTQHCSPVDAAKRFQFRAVKLLTMGGVCVAAKSAELGSQLWSADCDSFSPDELADWDLVGERIRLSGTDLCITARDGTAVPGAVVHLETCDAGSRRQRWIMSSSELRYLDDAGRGACLQVAGGTGVPGEALNLWNGCGFGFENLQFMARGRIESEGRCAGLLGDAAMTTPIGMATCDGSMAQIWDYYW